MKLLSPKTDESRPILDRVKESLFSVLLNKYGLPGGEAVADLFCGVGSLGIEALSRGAVFAVFVEKSSETFAILKKNIKKTDFLKESRIIKGDAFKIGAPVDQQKYAVVFVDPPYRLTEDVSVGSPLSGLLSLLPGQLTAAGIVVVRTHKSTELLTRYGPLAVIERRKWGNMAITILGHSSDNDE